MPAALDSICLPALFSTVSSLYVSIPTAWAIRSVVDVFIAAMPVFILEGFKEACIGSLPKLLPFTIYSWPEYKREIDELDKMPAV